MNISVCIITKNEKEKLSKCLEALRAYPFEIVVTDTGSVDGTREFIKEAADITGDFTWEDDFAKARNYCTSLASNDWIIALDSDEYVQNTDLDALRWFMDGGEDKIGRIERVNRIPGEKSPTGYELSHERISRMFNRNKCCFKGRIHEQIVCIDNAEPEYVNVPIEIEHDGYVGSEEELAKKAERNIELLLRDLMEFGDDPYVYYQLGKAYFTVKEYQKAFEYFEKGLGFELNPALSYVQDMIEAYGYTLLELGRFEDMLLLENVYNDMSDSADYLFLMGLAYMNNALFDRAVEEFIKATKAPLCNVEGSNGFKAFYNAGVIRECLGFTDEARRFYEKCGDYAPAMERLIDIFEPEEPEDSEHPKDSERQKEEELREIVFLPYKASMWDSLEGAYRKALEDKRNKVSVIPIPYYDKNPDGSFGRMYWEIGDYPKDVEVISYKEYDLKRHHPAEIYIHNPYDEGNHVTSVFPYYYSKNLKQFTDKLIYIPYFVLEEINSSNPQCVEAYSHLAQVSAVINADLVIVQSENIRKFYVESMVMAGGEELREYFGNKITVGASSKIEKVINAKESDFVIPDEWKNILYTPEGDKRKVMLYNTSVSSFLRDSDKMLLKIKSALNVFKENKGSIALLWRPHPLMESTIRAMRPELLDDYFEIVRIYREEGWGIYDDTSDLDRAIFLADAYYGDASSLVTLCKAKGMPIMIQNVNVR